MVEEEVEVDDKEEVDVRARSQTNLGKGESVSCGKEEEP